MLITVRIVFRPMSQKGVHRMPLPYDYSYARNGLPETLKAGQELAAMVAVRAL